MSMIEENDHGKANYAFWCGQNIHFKLSKEYINIPLFIELCGNSMKLVKLCKVIGRY